jgi:hypothetical protein
MLATIQNYVHGQAVADADIDNWPDCKILPSTGLLTEILESILEHGNGGGRSSQRAPGPRDLKGIGTS